MNACEVGCSESKIKSSTALTLFGFEIYSDREFRNVRHSILGQEKVIYDVYSTGWFPTFLFTGVAHWRDFVLFLEEK